MAAIAIAVALTAAGTASAVLMGTAVAAGVTALFGERS